MEELVLTGMGGRLPECEHMGEFAEKLFGGVDLVTADDRRWKPGLHGLPERNGKLKDLCRFDAAHFGVHGKQAHAMDPQLRLLLEATHEAIVDAGVAPSELKGSRTGVFVGVSNSESEEAWTADADAITGYALTGCCRAMFPNRISYTFDLRGPSYAIDTACSSSMFALAQAAASIRAGHCDAAIVAGSNLCLKPANSLNFHRLSMLSPEGRCAAFDASGRGYVRSEAVVAVFLQKKKDARRAYASVLAARCNTDGSKEQGITFPSGDQQRALAEETLKEARVQPKQVTYVEAHGTGTRVGDPQEVNAIAQLFCTSDRDKPLLLGSVKSNMGHSEPASGLCSIAKVLLAMQRGVIPGNLHYKAPNPDIPALSDGRITVVDRNTPWEGGIVSVNSFGFGGANAHVVLKSVDKREGAVSVPQEYPRLVLASGRTEDAVREMLLHAQRHRANAELLALMDHVHYGATATHRKRGFALLDANCADSDKLDHQILEFEGVERRPVWLVFSGMGSQWSGAGRELLRLPVFAESVALSEAALAPHGVALRALLTDAPPEAFEDVIACFVVIAAMQVALVDVLNAVGIVPDGILGHSVGEIGCAYADGTLTREQAVLAAYWRGRSIADTKLAPGAMAALGLSWEAAAKACPPEVQPACHNSPDSVTVSGPVDAVERLVAKLTAEGVFARRVASAGVAFHSRYIAEAAPKLRASLEKVLTRPKQRSHKWISTSVPQDQWDTELARSSSAAYHVNNLTSPVRFAEGMKHVPPKALVIEVAPHALLHAVLRRALPDAFHVPLIRRDQPPLRHLLAAIGRVFCGSSEAPRVGRLYPPVAWPVAPNTPPLGDIVRWDHSAEWDVAKFDGTSSGRELATDVDASKPEDAFVTGHRIDGRVLYPATGYLTLVWRSMARLHAREVTDTPVLLEDIQFHRATIVPADRALRFTFQLLSANGAFELMEGGALVVSGKVKIVEKPQEHRLQMPQDRETITDKDPMMIDLDADDVYKELKLRGYQYGGLFKGVRKADARGERGLLDWHQNWVSFIDTMLQFSIVGSDTRQLYLPTRLQRILIDPKAHQMAIDSAGKTDEGSVSLSVRHYRDIGVTVAGGVELRGLKTSLAPRRANPQPAPKLEKYEWVPHDNSSPSAEDPAKARNDALTVCMQLVIENLAMLRLKIGEAGGDKSAEALLTPSVLELLQTEPMMRADANVWGAAVAQWGSLKENGVQLQEKPLADGSRHLSLGVDVLALGGSAALLEMSTSLSAEGLLLLQEPRGASDDPVNRSTVHKAGLVLLARQAARTCEFLLLRRERELPQEKVIIKVTHPDYSWLEQLKTAMAEAERGSALRIYLTGGDDAGLVGMANCLRAEPGGACVRVLMGEKQSPDMSAKATQDILKLDLAVNILKGGRWGSFRHLRLMDGEARLQTEFAYVNTMTRGDLSSLRWVESPLRYFQDAPKSPEEELCTVYCAPLNFRDIMLATGKLPPDALPGKLAGQECILGLEFSGRDSSGMRVMGMVAAQGLATSVAAPLGFLWPVPSEWSLEQAATVPVAYATAYYALEVRGRLCRGDSVLIHAGSGGVGQAAISIALHAGATVFTTVGTEEKRAFIKRTFPQLTDKHIGNSRDTSFEQLVMRETKGRGVDLVLNSLAGEALLASVRCLAIGGRFLEIGKLDLSRDSPLGMSIFLKNTTFHGILLDALFEAPAQCPERLAVVEAVRRGIASGAVRPLPSTTFTRNQLEEAFRFMATGKHIGKVLLTVRDEESAKGAFSKALVSALPRTYMHPAKSYVLVGGLGGFGLELAGWLIDRGARTIVVTSRSGVRSGYQAWCVRRWRGAGVRVIVSTRDATDAAGAKALLLEAAKVSPVGGIFSLAAVLKDAFIENQTPENFKAVAKPKIDGTRALDIASREVCPLLEHFVVFSSVSCGRGNAGQSNYGLANSASELVCRRRRSLGLPALAVQWGAIGDVGMVMAMGGDDEVVGGTLPQRIVSCLDTLGALMSRADAVAASMVLADKKRSAAAPTQQLLHAVANILGIKDPEKVSDSANLAELGMDSLMGAEIKQTLERGFDLVLGVQEIRTLTFGKLRELSGCGSGGAEANADANAGSEAKSQVKSIGELIPSQPLVELKSASRESGGATLFMVHPIEGSASCLSEIAQHVEGGVVALQCTRSTPLGDMSALAAEYVRRLKARQSTPPFIICGYSFGASIAFEMALQLQKEGLESHLVLLDGSPEYVATHTKRGRGRRTTRIGAKDDEAADQAEALAYFMQLFTGMDSTKIAMEMMSLNSWEDRLAAAAKATAEATGATLAEATEAAALFYKKLVVGHTYRAQGKLRGQVALFTARDNYVELPADYGLGAVCVNPVAVTQLPADHRSLLNGQPAKQIAQHLSRLLKTC